MPAWPTMATITSSIGRGLDEIEHASRRPPKTGQPGPLVDASAALSPTKKIQKFDIALELHRLGLLRGSRSTLGVAPVSHLIAIAGVERAG
jgi:hypothetical protein